MSTIVLLIPTGVVLLLIVDWLRVARLYGGSRMAAFRLMIATLWASQSRWIIFAALLGILCTAYLALDALFWANVPPAVVVVLFSAALNCTATA